MITPRFGYRRFVVALLIAFALPLSVGAAEKTAAKQKANAMVPKIDLSGMGGALPAAEGLKSKKSESQPQELTTKSSTPDVAYSVLEVVHAQDFTRAAGGVKPVGGALKAISLYGKPPSTQKFTTLVKVKATRPVNTSIELVVLDTRGDTAMTGSGQLTFKPNEKAEVEYLMDWAPTPQPRGGDYKLLVRIGGQPMGTWPLKVLDEKR